MAQAIDDDRLRARARRQRQATTGVLALLGIGQSTSLAALASLGAVSDATSAAIFAAAALYPFALIGLRDLVGAQRIVVTASILAAVATTAVCWVTGGLASPVLPVFVLVPSAAFATGPKSLYRLGLAAVGGVLALAAGTALGAIPAFAPAGPTMDAMRLVGVAHALIIAMVGALGAERARATARRSIPQARDRAESAARARENFLAMMSHELRTPMTGILGTIQLLDDSELDAEQQRLLDQLSGAGDALHRVLDDIIEHAVSTSSDLVVEPRPTRLRQLIEQTVELYRPSALARDLTIRVDIAADAPCTVAVDPRRVRQILGHLLSNAVKYTEHGAIDVHARHADDWLEIEVADTGRGIDPAELDKIFEPFVQLSSGPRRAFGGAGLGLANAWNLAQHLGGVLSANSITGQGSVFTLGMPAEVCRPEPARDPTAEVPRLDPLGQRVLVVDDTEVVRLLLVRALELSGYIVDVATDGIEAVRAVQVGEYDAVVMDLHMPTMDGFTATEAIRSLPGTPSRVPVLAVTADLLPEQHDRARRAGVNGILTKPVDFVRLQRAVDGLITTADRDTLTM